MIFGAEKLVKNCDVLGEKSMRGQILDSQQGKKQDQQI